MTDLQFVQPDFAGKDGAHHQFGPVMRIKQPACFGQITVDGAWRQGERTGDLLLSDTVPLHRALRRAGVSAELHVAQASPHGGFMGQAPEDREILAECRRFMDAAWGVEA